MADPKRTTAGRPASSLDARRNERGGDGAPVGAALRRHSQTIAHTDYTVVAEIAEASANGFRLAYQVDGDIGALRLPPRREMARVDGLWRTTCLEAFLKPMGARGYWEINLSPSTAWASYAFADYRDGMAPADDVVAAAIDVETRNGRLHLAASVKTRNLDLRRCAVGLSAILETSDGAKSFWAIAHPSGAPDFHHADCFALLPLRNAT